MKAIRNVKFVLALMKIRISRQMAHAPSFWSALWIDTITFLIQAASFLAIYSQVDEINGWGRWQSVFFVGTFSLIDGIYMFLYFFGLLRLPELVSSGKLDPYLTKPVDPLLHLSFESIDPGSGMVIIPALVILVLSGSRLGIAVGPLRVLAYCGAIVLMIFLSYSLMLIVRLPSFFLRRVAAFSAAEESLIEFAFRVPGSAYRGAWKIVFRVLLPYGLIAGLPSDIFFSGGTWMEWATGISVAFAFFVLARLGWKAGLRRYESTGS
jgi:ABC-2 type transport system permease protein